MDYRQNDFDELEPRTTPQPTILKCMTVPSVPEVSLIFGKRFDTTQLPMKKEGTPEDKCKAYANWKKHGFPSVTDSKIIIEDLVNRQFNCESTVRKNTVSNEPSNFYTETGDINNRNKSLSNTIPIQYKQNQTIRVHKHSFVASARNNGGDNTHLHNYEHPSRDEISAFTFPRSESVEPPVQNRSYDAIKSILKSSLLKNTAITNLKSDNAVSSDCYLQSKSPSQSNRYHHHQTLQHIDDSLYSHPCPIPRCQHANEANREHDTVRDLLLLVQNQNEQIKSLQTQVERLLQTHEQNIGYLENRNSAITNSNGKSQSLGYNHETDTLSKNNVTSAQKTCSSRGIKMMSSHPSNEHPEVCLRHQSDPLRNTIVEKKVSIGVMTSFEFSVQNNPFVSDSDRQMNAAFQDCGTSISESGEAWRSNVHCSRKIATEPLENISEDSENHLSAIWKQSSNNTQVSSPEKLIAKINDNRVHIEDICGCSPNAKVSQLKPNANDSSVMFLNKPTQPPVRLENFRSRKDGLKYLPVKLDQQVQNVNLLEPKKIDLYREDDINNYSQAIGLEFSNNSYLQKNERTNPRNCGKSENKTMSIPPENTAEGSFVLCSSELKVTERSPPSPDPSIHVEMREYSSDEENEKSKRAPSVGWTFYKNVVGEVNRILHTMPGSQDVAANEKFNPLTFHNDIVGNDDILNPVKSATLERLKMLGISYAEHSEFNGEHTQKKVTFDSSYYPPEDYQANIPQSTNSVTETNISTHMKALALKYLNDEQLADLAVHKQGHGTAMKHKLLSSHGTNMSLATMNYLQRYCLVSRINTPNTEDKGHGSAIRQKKLKHLVMTKELLTQSTTRNHTIENCRNKGTSDNILDITTLKQQPKLL